MTLITTNCPPDGTFALYADLNEEPFFWHELGSNFQAKRLSVGAEDEDLIVFYDCSIGHCGKSGKSGKSDNLYGMRKGSY